MEKGNAPHARKPLPPKLSEPQTNDLVCRSRPFCLVVTRAPSSPLGGQLIVGISGDDVDWWFAHRGFGGGEAREARGRDAFGLGIKFRFPSVTFDTVTEAGSSVAVAAAVDHGKCRPRPWPSTFLPCKKPHGNASVETLVFGVFQVGCFWFGHGQSSPPAYECFDPGGLRSGRHAGLGCSMPGLCVSLVVIDGIHCVHITMEMQVSGKRDNGEQLMLSLQRRWLGEVSDQEVWLHGGRRSVGAWPGQSTTYLSVSSLEKATMAGAFWSFFFLPSLITHGTHLSFIGNHSTHFPGFYGSRISSYHFKPCKSLPFRIWKSADPWSFIDLIRCLILVPKKLRFLLDCNFGWDPGGSNAKVKSRMLGYRFSFVHAFGFFVFCFQDGFTKVDAFLSNVSWPQRRGCVPLALIRPISCRVGACLRRELSGEFRAYPCCLKPRLIVDWLLLFLPSIGCSLKLSLVAPVDATFVSASRVCWLSFVVFGSHGSFWLVDVFLGVSGLAWPFVLFSRMFGRSRTCTRSFAVFFCRFSFVV